MILPGRARLLTAYPDDPGGPRPSDSPHSLSDHRHDPAPARCPFPSCVRSGFPILEEHGVFIVVRVRDLVAIGALRAKGACGIVIARGARTHVVLSLGGEREEPAGRRF